MSQRLRKAQERQILHEMLALARFLGARGVPCPQVTEAVKQLRDDLVRAYRAGISTITVDRKSYLERGTQVHGRKENAHATG